MRKNLSIKWQADKQPTAAKQKQGKQLKAVAGNKAMVAVMPTADGIEKNCSDPELLQRITENMPGILMEYVSNTDGTHEFVYLSPSFERIFGVRANHIHKMTQFVHPDDFHEMNNALDKAAETLEQFYIESRIILPGRGLMWRSLNCTFSHFTKEGGKVFSGLMMDISDRKKADEIIKKLLG